MRFLCKLGFHRFGNWGEKFMPRGAAFAFEYQQRKCECCGYVDERQI